MSALLEKSMKLADERLQALDRPHLKSENYRFTPVQDVPVDEPSTLASDISENQAAEYLPQEDAHRVRSSKTVPFLIQEWTASSLQDQILPSEALKDDFFAYASINKNFEGFELRIPKNLRVDLPFHHIWMLAGEPGTRRSRLRIHLEEGAQLQLFSASFSEAKQQAFSLQTFVLEKNASLEFCDFQGFSDQTRYFIRKEIFLAEGAQMKAHWASLGGGLGQYRVHVESRGPNSQFEGTRSLSLRASQHSDFWIENRHLAEKTKSSMRQWAVLDEKSRSVFNGLIRIPSGMNGADALHRSKCLMLSDRASAENMPKLIIENDDVQVAHGASVSRVDEDQLYYLQSRGLGRAEAENILVEGFIRSSWASVENIAWQNFLEKEFSRG